MLISSSCPQPQLGLPLIRLLSKALTPLFDRLLNGLVSARKKVVALVEVCPLDSKVPACQRCVLEPCPALALRDLVVPINYFKPMPRLP